MALSYLKKCKMCIRDSLIEGQLDPKAKVGVVEDLISTGGSSLKAVEARRKNGNEIVGMVASYTYGFRCV